MEGDLNFRLSHLIERIDEADRKRLEACTQQVRAQTELERQRMVAKQCCAHLAHVVDAVVEDLNAVFVPKGIRLEYEQRPPVTCIMLLIFTATVRGEIQKETLRLTIGAHGEVAAGRGTREMHRFDTVSNVSEMTEDTLKNLLIDYVELVCGV